MDITGADTLNASATHEIGHEDEKDVQNTTKNNHKMFDSPSGKRIRSKEDNKISGQTFKGYEECRT